MLPLVYNDFELAHKIVEDPQAAPIPDLHKAMYAWVEKFTRRSWEMGPEDTQALRDAGATDRDIAAWGFAACGQTWWVMMGDGGGVALEGDMPVGLVVGKTRDWYTKSPEGMLATAPASNNTGHGENGHQSAWIDTDEDTPEFKKAAAWAQERYGFVPNLFSAVSLAPESLRRHTSALELLERPQSATLSRREHALVRALVSTLNRSDYSRVTTRALLEGMPDGEASYEKVTGPWNADAWDARDRVVLEFAIKATCSTYKITEKDAQAFRDCGLGDEAYVDVLNTVAIQTSLDRLTNSLGVAPDKSPLLALEKSPT